MSDDSHPQNVPPATPEGGGSPAPRQRFVQPYPGAAPVPVPDQPTHYDARRESPAVSGFSPGAPGGAAPYAGAPYGAGAPAWTTPSGPRSKALAVVALSLAIGGAIFTVLPILSLLAAPVLIAAFVCALVALIGRKHGGKGLSIAALATSVLSGIVATVLVFGSALLFGLGGWWHSSNPGSPFNPFGPFSDGVTEDGYPDDVYPDERNPEDGFAGDGSAEYGADLDLVQGEVVLGSYDGDETTWWYGVVLENPNPDAVFEDVQIVVEAIGADGNVVATDEKYLTIQPGPTAIAGMFFDAGDSTITEIQVQLPEPGFARLIEPGETGSVTVGDVQTSTSGDMPVVSGTLRNDTGSEQQYARVVVLARDANGTLIAAEPGFVDPIPAGSSAPFEVYFYDPLPAGVTFEAYVTL
jgi:hypothetical protein